MYKNFDPRAAVIRKVAEEVFEIQGRDPLIDVAIALEKAARADSYFKERKLYPNVDFYSGKHAINSQLHRVVVRLRPGFLTAHGQDAQSQDYEKIHSCFQEICALSKPNVQVWCTRQWASPRSISQCFLQFLELRAILLTGRNL